jgi:hypothetical protein
MLPRRKIHEVTWTSPDGKTHNKIDLILIEQYRVELSNRFTTSENLDTEVDVKAKLSL